MSKNSISFERVDFSHCLRKEFTINVIHRMRNERKSFNLVGEQGTGKTRLLEDIRKCDLPDTQIVCVNLKDYLNTYSGLLREIQSQLGLEGETPAHLSKLFEHLESRIYYLFSLDNYDALLDNTKLDEKYDKNFFDDLNFIKNRDNISLLCVTSKQHNTQQIFIAGEPLENSPLTLEFEYMQELDREQIVMELNRKLDEYDRRWLQPDPEIKELVIRSVKGLPLPLPRLCFIIEKFKNHSFEEHSTRLKKSLTQWMDEFDKKRKKNWKKRLVKFRQRIDSIKSAAGVKKIRIPVIGGIVAAFKILKKKWGI